MVYGKAHEGIPHRDPDWKANRLRVGVTTAGARHEREAQRCRISHILIYRTRRRRALKTQTGR